VIGVVAEAVVDGAVIVGLGVAYSTAIAVTWWGISYGQHMLRRVDQSATETAMTETAK
jgi:hypothetical protein